MATFGGLPLKTDDAETALAAWSRVLDQDPHDRGAHKRTIQLLVGLGRRAEAIPHLRVLIETAPEEPKLLRLLGKWLRDLGDREGEIQTWRRVLNLSFSDRVAHERLAELLDESDRTEARLHLLIAADLGGDQPEMWKRLAQRLQAAQQLEESLEAWRRVDRLSADDREARNNLAQLLFELRRPAEAVRYLRLVAADSPDDEDAWRRLARSLNEVGDSDGELSAWRNVLALAPDDSEAHRSVAEILVSIGRQTEAAPHIAAVAANAQIPFQNSEQYWIDRYATGHYSGAGSYGKLAEFKAKVLNRFVMENKIESVIEFGCGDGHQLLLATYPSYLGFDVSPAAVDLCGTMFAEDQSKRFLTLNDYSGHRAALTLSLDVIYHLIEDDVFASHMEMLFSAAERFVGIYSSNDPTLVNVHSHIRHRRFTDWIDQSHVPFQLIERLPNPYPYPVIGTINRGRAVARSPSDFYFFSRA